MNPEAVSSMIFKAASKYFLFIQVAFAARLFYHPLLKPL